MDVEILTVTHPLPQVVLTLIQQRFLTFEAKLISGMASHVGASLSCSSGTDNARHLGQKVQRRLNVLIAANERVEPAQPVC